MQSMMTQQAPNACDSSELEPLLSCKLLERLLSGVKLEHATQQGECVQMYGVFLMTQQEVQGIKGVCWPQSPRFSSI